MDDVTPQPNKIVGAPTGTMERLLGRLGFDPEAKKPTVFTMECPIPEQGNDRVYLSHTDKTWMFFVLKPLRISTASGTILYMKWGLNRHSPDERLLKAKSARICYF